MLKIIFNRKNQIILFFVMVFILLGFRLYQLTIVDGAMYYDRSINNRIKKIETYAKRGDIYDRNGLLLATSNVGYKLMLNSAMIPSDRFSEFSISLYDFLVEQNEQRIEFPIVFIDGKLEYVFDINIARWKENNGYSLDMSAEDIFKDVRQRNFLDTELSDFEAFRILYNQGKYMPISTSRMKFLDEIYKDNFLKLYGLDIGLSAEEAFYKIRQRRDFKIDKSLSDEDAYKVLVFRHAIKEQGFLKYEPIVIAGSISDVTAIRIQERIYEFPGTYIEYESIRTYPHSSAAAHILGYMGKIATENEIERFVKENDYNPNQLIGKTGIEGTYELNLHGESGYKYIEVDVSGKYVADLSEEEYGLVSKKATAGKDIYLTIDLELQKTLEESLEYALSEIRKGGVYKSPWGDFDYPRAYKNAETGAGVVVNVRTGEILAMASYPSYDLNLFSKGISQENWNALNPANTRNPLAARPLFNTATMMAVQPGSIYKMITAYAAMEQGLDPKLRLQDGGFVKIGNQSYGCILWNTSRRTHGLVDLYKGLEVSCNYYFFNIATGKDFYRNRPLNYTITPQIIVDESKKFGLDERTGIEIAETSLGIPDPDKKKRTIKILLGRKLREISRLYFPDEITNNKDSLNKVVNEIVSWADENPSRGQIIQRLLDLGSNPDYYVTEKLADLIKYDYFNLMKWYEGDTLNLSMGQGDHTYTPVQMARYTATIANGGYLKDLTLIKRVGNEAVMKNQGAQTSFDTKGYLKDIQKGMLAVTRGSEGSARKAFGNFPIIVAGKTGTAEKEGFIPPLDEVQYLTEYLSAFAPRLKIEDVEARTVEIIKERSEEISLLEKAKNEEQDDEKREEKQQQLNRLVERDYLNKGTAMRVAIKELSGYQITDDQINQYRLPYDNYSWFVSYAPYDNPEIAVVISLPQGGTGGYGTPIAREVYAKYFGLTPPE